MRKQLKFQILSIVLVVLVAVLGSIFVNIGMDWYSSVTKPTQWIPSFVIPIVWSIVYLLAILCLWVQISNSTITTLTTILFVLNGVLNVLWCLVFFTLRLTLLAEIVIILNLVFGWILYVKIKGQNLYANLLLIYPIWLSIATSLNTAIWILN